MVIFKSHITAKVSMKTALFRCQIDCENMKSTYGADSKEFLLGEYMVRLLRAEMRIGWPN